MISLRLVKARALSAAAICVSGNTIVLSVLGYFRSLEFVVPISDYDSPPRDCREYFSRNFKELKTALSCSDDLSPREFALRVEREIRTMIRCGRYRRGRCHRRNAIPKQRGREGGVCHPRVFASGLKIAGAFFRYTRRRAASVARFDTDTGQ